MLLAYLVFHVTRHARSRDVTINDTTILFTYIIVNNTYTSMVIDK